MAIGTPALSSTGSGGSSSITSLLGITTKGQATMANSLPVVIASDQSAIPVTGGGGTQYADGTATPTHPTGNALVYDKSGTLTDVSLTNPFPIQLRNSSGTEIGTTTNPVAIQPPASGSLVVSQSTAANLNATVVGTGTFAVQSTLAAETTKVIGTVRNADGAGNLLTTNSTTYTAKFALDGNLLGTLGTAFTTAGKVDVKGADGDVFVRQATAANLNATVVGTGTFAVQATPVTQADTFMLGGVNIKEINAVTPLMGNGTTGTGSLRVTIASDNTAFSVNSTLSAETTKVIGVVRTADGSGNLLTSTGNALDVNIKSEAAPALTLTRVAIAASSAGDNTIIAAVTNKKIYVVAFELSFSGTVNAKFTDGASGTNLGGLYYGIANAGAANSMSPDMKLATPSPYLWVGSTSTALILNLSGATAVGGAITYFAV